MDTINILYRNIRLRFANLISIFITILQPIIWLLLYSGVAGETMKDTGIENYTSFILPGLMLLLIFGVSASTGMMNYIMINNKSFNRILIAPVKRSSIVLGQILEGVLCSFLELSIMIVFSFFLGVDFPKSLGAIISLVIILFFTAFFMASISYSISLSLPNEIIYETVMNALVLPLFFLSSALFPVDGLRGLLGFLVNINPFTHVVELMREIIFTGLVDPYRMIRFLIIFTFLNLLAFSLSLLKLKRYE